MRPDAERILAIFRLRGLRAGSLIYLGDLRQAVSWNRGVANDGDLRRALGDLLDDGYLIETRAAVELTPKAEAYIYGEGDQQHAWDHCEHPRRRWPDHRDRCTRPWTTQQRAEP